MRGRQVFMESLLAHGVDAIFGNPGTTENPVLDSLVDYPRMRYYVALHEGVAAGAANFYAQAGHTTGVVNLHVAPGLGNAIGMIYGALKASVPLIVTAGQQDTRMRLRDPLLGHDLVAMAAPVTKWSVEAQSADEIAPIMARAFQVANEHPAGPVFVALPVNVMEQETTHQAYTAGELHREMHASPAGIQRIADLMRAARCPAIIAGDDVAVQDANAAVASLAEATGAAVYLEFLRSRLNVSNQHPNLRDRVPYDAAAARRMLEGHDFFLLIGGWFFEDVWFDDLNALPESAVVTQIEASGTRMARNYPVAAGVYGHVGHAVRALDATLRAAATPADTAAAYARNEALAARKAAERAALTQQLEKQAAALPMTPLTAVHEVAQAMPARGIVIDETITAIPEVARVFRFEHSLDYFAGRGGGIGQGVAGALGIAAAHPDRHVVALSGDGSAMYSIQALWTAAHHRLKIVFVILSNREYRVLKHNLDIYRQRFNAPADKPYPYMNLNEPLLGFSQMAEGMGVPAQQVTTPAELRQALAAAFAADGPYLLDVVVAGKQ